MICKFIQNYLIGASKKIKSKRNSRKSWEIGASVKKRNGARMTTLEFHISIECSNSEALMSIGKRQRIFEE